MPEEKPEKLQLESTEDLVTNRRIEGIFDARYRVRKVRHGMKENEDKTTFELCTSYRTALEAYLQAIQPLFSASQTGTEYWENTAFGEIVLPTPEETVIEPPKTRRFRLIGLQSLFTQPDKFSGVFKVSARKGSRTVIEEKPVTIQIGLSTLDDMFFATNEFLPKVGIEVQVEKDKPPAEI